jgi:hypothetical protein
MMLQSGNAEVSDTTGDAMNAATGKQNNYNFDAR